MAQTLSRAPAISDILFAHLWYAILEEAVARPREEQTRLLLQPEVHRPAERKSSSPAPHGSPCLPPTTSQGSCDLCLDAEVNAGASAPLLPGGWVVTGGPFKPQQQLMYLEEQSPTGSFYYFPVLKTDSSF